MLVSALINNMAVAQKLDSSNFEDIARLFMGSEAYLLFHFDKLVVQTLKTIPNWKNNDDC